MEITPIDRLHAVLSNLMGDDEIIARPRFKQSGLVKIAKKIGVEPNEVDALILELSKSLSTKSGGLFENGEQRYSWEDDDLGNITVRDSKTGDEKYISVQKASNIIKQLDDGNIPEQDILSKAMNESQGDNNSEVTKDVGELPADEMVFGSSTFNFPWKVDGRNGFGTARFSGTGRSFNIRVISVVDSKGDPLDASPNLIGKITQAAKDFVHEA